MSRSWRGSGSSSQSRPAGSTFRAKAMATDGVQVPTASTARAVPRAWADRSTARAIRIAASPEESPGARRSPHLVKLQPSAATLRSMPTSAMLERSWESHEA